ncbi:initiation-control protein YabA [Corticicoccus populi]|uniref:Initiation-control protein YabA n=1 Tax=Corticicoccus populi TaxID=1812821 RepID=A0ABW5X2A2_9STAP
MERDQLFSHINQIEDNMEKMQKDMQILKEFAVKLVEENVSLQMEKEHFEDLLREQSETTDGFKQNTLKNLYDEGFHVCSVHFGTHRHGEDCLFCQGFLNHRND